MKKLIYSAMAATMLLATSCQDDMANSFVGEEATVEFNISTPEIATRAYSVADEIDHLHYAVYEEDGTITQLTATEVPFDKLGKSLSLKLKTGKTYQVVFWADDENAPYFIDFENKRMSIVYTNQNQMVCNNEKLDAFYYSGQITVEGNKTIGVTLTRPFAQINVVTNDYEDAKKANYIPTQSEIKVKSYTTLNLWDGSVDDEVELTYAYSAIPTVEFESNNIVGYKYIAMSYVLMGSNEAVDVTFSHKNNKDESVRTVGAVPLARNYRTNLYGSLLTSDATVNVGIEAAFVNDYDKEAPKVVEVATAEELNTALADPEVGEVVLNSDINTEGFVFAAPATRATVTYAGRDIIIDGNGKTLTYKGAVGGRIIDFQSETNGANLTLKNLTIINNVSWIERAVNYNTNGTLTLENVTIKSAEGCSLNYAINLPGSSDNAVVEIKNCEIWAGAQALNLWGERTLVNVTDSDLYVVDNSAAEGRSVVAINNDGETIADYCVLDFNGGSIQVVYVGEGETKPSYAIRNNTAHSTINVSPDTNVVGEISNPVAIIYWEGQNQYYSLPDLNAALDAAVPTYKATGVRMINDLTLPLAKKAIYGTPVAVQMKNGGVFDGCNNTLSVENPEYNAYVVETYGGTIKNLNITTPAGRGIIISSPKEDIYLDNVVVNGPGYALNTTEHNGKKLVVTNSTFKGWTSLAGLESISFTSCTFGENTYAYWQKFGYEQDYDRLIRPYAATSFDSCVFEEGFYVYLDQLPASAKVTLKDCVCGNVELTAENYSQYITIELPSGRTLADCVVFE